MAHGEAGKPDERLRSKGGFYARLAEELELLIADQRFWVSNLANAASLLWHGYRGFEPFAEEKVINWLGFYVTDTAKNKGSETSCLLLGPFQGKPACQWIEFGKGVCGSAAESGTTLVVGDVHQFPGHIACDDQTNSEIVVPIVYEQRVVAVLDIDCQHLNAFDKEDMTGLEAIANLLARRCDWP